jgi:hypothetical protein
MLLALMIIVSSPVPALRTSIPQRQTHPRHWSYWHYRLRQQHPKAQLRRFITHLC